MATPPQTSGGVLLSFTEDKPGYRRVVEHINAIDHLLKRLNDIQASRVSDLFIGVNVNDMANNGLAIGLADAMWAVLFGDAEATELSYSVGDADAEGDIELRFEQWEVLPRKSFLPVEKATEVIRTWFTTGELSKNIEWERRSLLPDNL